MPKTFRNLGPADSAPNTIAQNHWIVAFGQELWRPPSLILSSEEGQGQQIPQDWVQLCFKCLQRWRVHTLSAKPVQTFWTSVLCLESEFGAMSHCLIRVKWQTHLWKHILRIKPELHSNNSASLNALLFITLLSKQSTTRAFSTCAPISELYKQHWIKPWWWEILGILCPSTAAQIYSSSRALTLWVLSREKGLSASKFTLSF